MWRQSQCALRASVLARSRITPGKSTRVSGALRAGVLARDRIPAQCLPRSLNAFEAMARASNADCFGPTFLFSAIYSHSRHPEIGVTCSPCKGRTEASWRVFDSDDAKGWQFGGGTPRRGAGQPSAPVADPVETNLVTFVQSRTKSSAERFDPSVGQVALEHGALHSFAVRLQGSHDPCAFPILGDVVAN